MHRTEGDNNDANLFTNLIGGGTEGTKVEENWLNAVQEEIATVIEGASITLKTAGTDTRDQLLAAIASLIDTDIAAITPIIPATTAMVFFQAAAPTGWTQTVAHTNKGLRVVDGAGGGAGGTLVFDSATVSSHTLTEAEMPAHTHNAGASRAVAAAAVTVRDSTEGNIATSSTGGGGGHNHGLDLKYIDVITCTKD
jgi:hypothetical protein